MFEWEWNRQTGNQPTSTEKHCNVGGPFKCNWYRFTVSDTPCLLLDSSSGLQSPYFVPRMSGRQGELPIFAEETCGVSDEIIGPVADPIFAVPAGKGAYP